MTKFKISRLGFCLPAIADNQDMISRIRLKLNNEIRL